MAQTFRRAHSQYSRYINSQIKQRSGHLWQGRYYSCPLDGPHLEAALLYVERNPVRAGIEKAASDYRWSSAPARLGTVAQPRFLELQEWSKCYSRQEWQNKLADCHDRDVERSLRESTLQGKPFGSAAFIEEMEQLTGRPMKVRPSGRTTRKVDAKSGRR